MSERQARRLVRPLVDRGLLIGAKDAPLRIAFTLGESERLFPHLWAPAGVTMALDLPPDVDDALRAPRAMLPRCSDASRDSSSACSPCASRPTCQPGATH
jgi:hypothetical protein